MEEINILGALFVNNVYLVIMHVLPLFHFLEIHLHAAWGVSLPPSSLYFLLSIWWRNTTPKWLGCLLWSHL